MSEPTAPVLPATSRDPGPLRYGLIGPGFIGDAHLTRLAALPMARAVAVAGRDAGKAAVSARAHGLRAHATVDDLLVDPEVDAVLIATPHTTHEELARRAFAAGRHVLVEKPVSHRLSGALAMTAAWRAARATYPNINYGVMFQERMQPGWTLLRELLAARVLGRLQRVTWIDTEWYRTMAYYRTAAWRATWEGEGGGVLINQAVHRLDLYGWLFGAPARVRAFGALGKHHCIETEDEVTLLLEHAGGLVGHFITSTAEFPGTHRLEIVGEHGRLVWEHGRLERDSTSVSVLDFIHENRERFGLPVTTREAVELPAPLADPHSVLLADFTTATLAHREPAVTGVDGEAAVALVNAAMLAMYRDAPVALPLDAAEYDAWLAARVARRGQP